MYTDIIFPAAGVECGSEERSVPTLCSSLCFPLFKMLRGVHATSSSALLI